MTETDTDRDLVVIDRVEAVRDLWTDPDASYPGDPYDHNLFSQHYCDHYPVVFRMTAALLDRLTHHCHIFEKHGESYRFGESVKRDRPAKK